jgi:hypothetical protein
VTWDLDEEERRVGRSGNDLGAGLRDAAAGSTSDHVRGGFLPAFTLLSSTRLGRSTPRYGGSGPCIVKVEHQFCFAFLDKWIYHYICFLISDFIASLLRQGVVAIAAIANISLTLEERRHTLQIGVSIGVHGRRVPGLNLLASHVHGRRV